MKTIIKSTLLAAGAVALLSSCDENAWNDHLDGFETPETGVTVEALNYTLTAADYTKIATKAPYITGADDATLAALKLIGKDGAFATQEEALAYIPKFLRDSTNNFFALSNGSAVKVTYNVTSDMPADVKNIRSNTSTMTVGEADYQAAWGSEEDYIDAYAPASPASRNIPALLRSNYSDAAAGDYVVVNYNEAAENPVFGTIGGGDEPSFELSEVLNDIALDDQVEVNGVVTAIQNRGFVLTDNGGSILCYQQSGFDTSSVALGDYVTISGEITDFGTAYQLDLTQCTYNVVGAGKYTYPSPAFYTTADIVEAVKRSGDYTAEYVSFIGTVKFSGNYVNFILDGEEKVQGSGYQVPADMKAKLNDGSRMKITGYFVSVSSGKFFNVVITDAEDASSKAAAKSVASVPTSVEKNAIYSFDGSTWTVPSNTVVLQPADYVAMGQSYGNLSGTLPSQLLPVYLRQNHPYAAAEDVITVAYKYYNGSSTSYSATAFTFDGSEWKEMKGETTSQFVKQNGYWMYNPSVVMTLPYSRNTDPSYTYYMQCLEWVFENISKPMGATVTTSAPFIDYRGNAEFYSGSSAYYGNVDVRATTAVNNAPEGYTGYDGLSDEEITLLVKKRFCTETMPYAMSKMNPDAMPVAGMEVTYTVNFTAYTVNGAVEEQVVFTVEGPATFKYKSSTWVTEGQDAQW